MNAQIRPEPTAAERRAIAAAIAPVRSGGPPDPYASAWRRRGLDYAIARPGPRSRLGADRA